MRSMLLSIVLVGGGLVFAANATVSQPDSDLHQKVQAVFETHCIHCHNAELPQGGLDMSTAETFFQGGLSGGVIVRENPENSLLLKMVKHEVEPTMPFGMDQIPEKDIATIEAWIQAGAPWKSGKRIKKDLTKHWAYQNVVKPDVPSVDRKAWANNPIDRFVLEKLNELNLKPSKEAKRETLIRRLSLDLTGLPPDPVEVDLFLQDDSPDAYKKLVERYLTSPHFGERWAAHWLDLARYADSNGFEKDGQREMWPYRDYVIDAFNSDMPHDQFTIEQIAGDLLPGSTLKQKVATGYNRNTMLNLEGGVNQEEYRVAAVMDRVNTTSEVWLGSTMACAQCHDHKFDPFSQKDYFQMFAFFNNTKKEIKQVEPFEARSNGPLVHVPNEEQQKIIDRLTPRIDMLKAKLNVQTPELTEAQAEWEQDILENELDWRVIEPLQITSEHGTKFKITPDRSVLAVGENPIKDEYRVVLDFGAVPVTGIRLEILQDESVKDGGPGRRHQGRFTLTDVQLDAYIDKETPREIRLINPSADWGGNAIGSTLDDNENAGWGNGRENQRNFEAVYQTPNLDLLRDDMKFVLTIKTLRGAGENIGKFRVAVTSDENPQANPIPDDVYAILKAKPDHRTKEESEKLSAYYRSVSPLLDDVRKEIAQLKMKLPKTLPTVLVMEEREEPRQTHIFKKGSYLNPGEPVEPNIPAIFRNGDESQWNDRLNFARWLVDEENPLTARVYVNRVWEQIFGYGIVETTEDFGTRSPKPSNQELLDWLAYRFMENHWSLKSLLYLIVTSSTYKQDSAITPEKLEADPKNRYLARGPAFRLRAEFIRDNGLKISGLLNPKLGGPSVFPYQPEGIWQMPYSNAKWVESEDGDQFRRGLYTHWQRSATYPTYINFDAPSREQRCTRRIRTNTPLQALNLLNDPAFFVMAQGLADRMLAETQGSVEKRLAYGFRVCTGRYPNEDELNSLKSYFDKQLDYFEEHPNEAGEVLWAGGKKKEIETSEHAALVMASNVLLNLDETITKR